MKTITAKFNVAEITEYGSGGGSKVVLLPAKVDALEIENLQGAKIEMSFKGKALLDFGIYDVTFARAYEHRETTLSESTNGTVKSFSDMTQHEKVNHLQKGTANYKAEAMDRQREAFKCPDPDYSKCHAELNATSPQPLEGWKIQVKVDAKDVTIAQLEKSLDDYGELIRALEFSNCAQLKRIAECEETSAILSNNNEEYIAEIAKLKRKNKRLKNRRSKPDRDQKRLDRRGL